MVQTRLIGLAFTHINYDKDTNVDKVIEILLVKREKALKFVNAYCIDRN